MGQGRRRKGRMGKKCNKIKYYKAINIIKGWRVVGQRRKLEEEVTVTLPTKDQILLS